MPSPDFQLMASEDSSTTEMPDSGQIAGGDGMEPASTTSSRESDPLATFGDRLRPSRRFYANPAGS